MSLSGSAILHDLEDLRKRAEKAEAERDGYKRRAEEAEHIISSHQFEKSCAATPLMADVLAERDRFKAQLAAIRRLTEPCPCPECRLEGFHKLGCSRR